jgi:hypothetical protein
MQEYVTFKYGNNVKIFKKWDLLTILLKIFLSSTAEEWNAYTSRF